MTIDRRAFMTGAAGFGLAAAAEEANAASPSSGLSAQAISSGDASLLPGLATGTASGEIPKINLKHAFSLSIFFKERIRIDSPTGRVYVPAMGGEIWGPRLQGRVVPYGGADYARGQGFDAHYMLEASDGALIYIRNRGYIKRLGDSPSVLPEPPPRKPGEPLDQNMPAGVGANVPIRMRITPLFDAPIGPHDWMNRTLIIGHGARYWNPDHTIFTYYEVL
jgi:hypothetical protein